VPDYAESDPLRVTLLLQRLSDGHHSAADELLPLVYGELHRIARSFFRHQPSGHTLQPTALVNEAYIRFFDKEAPPYHRTCSFLALMACHAANPGGPRVPWHRQRSGRGKVTWDTNIEIQGGDGTHQMKVLEVHEALEALARENTSFAQVIEMHYFGGLTAAEMALATGKSIHIVQHELRFARAWLRRQMAAE
jgi:DNA-directed RNA polymerase specialized sigma24 family protein